MSFTVSAADVRDARAIARNVDIPAMQNSPLYRTKFPQSDVITDAQRDEVTRWQTDILENSFRGDLKSFLKTSTPDGTIVGFCGWRVIERKCEHRQAGGSTSRLWERRMTVPRAPEAIDGDGWHKLLTRLETECHRILRNQDKVCRLIYMAVDPNHQRSGIGSMMLERVCEEADRHGRCAYVQSTPEAVRLYTKFGFETVGHVETAQGLITSMLRQPQQS